MVAMVRCFLLYDLFFLQGQIVKGYWTGDVGGPREMKTWITNPKIKLTIKPDETGREKRCVFILQYMVQCSKRGCIRNLFIGLYINDTRLTLGKEYYTDPLYKVRMMQHVLLTCSLCNSGGGQL